MTSSMQARQSLGNLSELFTYMLGDDAAAIGAATPDAPPENRFCPLLNIKTIALPRQALDKHRETQKTDPFPCSLKGFERVLIKAGSSTVVTFTYEHA